MQRLRDTRRNMFRAGVMKLADVKIMLDYYRATHNDAASVSATLMRMPPLDITAVNTKIS